MKNIISEESQKRIREAFKKVEAKKNIEEDKKTDVVSCIDADANKVFKNMFGF